MNPLDSYLGQIARELRSLPSSKRDDDIRELRSHLEQRIEDFESAGLSPETAATSAFQEFGSARSVGSKLCDAWEGIPFSASRLLLALSVVTTIWFTTQFLLFHSLFRFALPIPPYRAAVALLPELPYVWAAVLFSVPFGCGILFSLWLGRRGRLASVAFFGFMWALALVPQSLFAVLPSHIAVLSGNAIHISGPLFLPLPCIHMVLAFAGASLSHILRTRRLKWVLANGSLITSPSSSASILPQKSTLIAGVLLVLVGLLGWGRVHTAFHPTTPVDVLRASLLANRGMVSGDFEVPTILELRELPLSTPAERAGQEKRVFFRVEVRATKDYAARRIAYVKKELASAKTSAPWNENSFRQSLKRLQRGRHQVQGTARLTKTPIGWVVDENSFDRSILWAWCYDLYYDA